MDNEKDLPVSFFRLSNGDDLISEIKEENKTLYTLSNPMRVLIDSDLEAGKQTIYMHPWLPQGIMNVGSCLLNKKDVLTTGKLEADIEEYYRGMVFEIFEDKLPKLKASKDKKTYNDPDKKIISFTKNKDKE